MKNKIQSDANAISVFGSIDSKLFLVLLVVYIAFLFVICVIFREPQDVVPRPGLFRSYRAAWNGGHLFPFAQNIIFNMLLYTPVGFGLGGYLVNKMNAIKREESGKNVLDTDTNDASKIIIKILLCCMFLGFTVSFAIERMQMHFQRGTYETDDLLNNTFGALLGASWLIMIKNRKWISKLIWITGVFLTISIVLLSRWAWLCFYR